MDKVTNVIRHLAASWSGSVIVAGEFEHTVHIWDLANLTNIGTFSSILDFGGNRIAIAPDGKSFVAAAYNVQGIAGYSTADGTERWRRKDLKKTQHLRISHDGIRVYACFDNRSCHVLNRESGKTIKTWAGVRNVWESPYEEILLLVKRMLVLQSSGEQKITSITRETFAVLCAAFAPGLVCVSESGGPLRCLNTQTGEEHWRFQEMGHHFLEIAFAEQEQAFVGVCWAYNSGGYFRLLRFEPLSGAATVVTELGTGSTFEFCLRGSRLLCSDGSIIETATGRREGRLAFPAERSGN